MKSQQKRPQTHNIEVANIDTMVDILGRRINPHFSDTLVKIIFILLNTILKEVNRIRIFLPWQKKVF